jgi:hypothetical protein
MVMAFFRFCGWLLPAPCLEELTSESFETLREKYRSRECWGNFLGFLAFVGLAVIYYFAISWLADWTMQRYVDAKFLDHRSGFEHALMGISLSLCSSMFLCVLVMRAFLGRKEYDIYMAYGGRLVPGHWHVGKVFTWIFLSFFPAAGIACVLRTTTFTAVTEEAIFVSSFGSFGVPREHRYADVCGVGFASKFHGRFKDGVAPRYLIVFKDGSQWRSNADSKGETAMVRYVAQQSRLPIVNSEFIEDIPR